MANKIATGGIAEFSGQYKVLGTKQEITLIKGHRVPPYDGKAQDFILVDKTKHKS